MRVVNFLLLCLLAPFFLQGDSIYDNNEKHLASFFYIQPILPPSIIVFNPQYGKKLIYVAVHHTNDLKSPTINVIKELIESEQPDICILEGFPSSEGIDSKRMIAVAKDMYSEGTCGENCYAVYLCQHNNIRFIGGDIEEKVYLESFKKFGISQKDIVFFLLAQQIPFWHRDGQFANKEIKSLFENFIRKEISIWLDLPSLEYSYEDFLVWHLSHIGKPYNQQKDFLWTPGSNGEFEPYLGKNATIYQKISAYTLYMRDKEILALIDKMMARYTKVLIIYGSNHYRNQASLLEAKYGTPCSRHIDK